MYFNSLCDGCLKPVGRRLALLGAKDEYGCYSESYVKCFWNLCDLHRSNHDVAIKTDNKVVTVEPMRQEMPYKHRSVVHGDKCRNYQTMN